MQHFEPRYRYDWSPQVETLRFCLVKRQLIVPVELVPVEFKARLRLRVLYGKRYLEPLRRELKYLGVKRGRRRVYLAQMSIGRLTSKKIEVIRKLGKKSEKHKTLLLVDNRVTRRNYQADPTILTELTRYLGKHHRCLIFSWHEWPSQMQLAALAGLLAGKPRDDRLEVPSVE